ncbi:hypothetical protein EFQ32_03965 [Limosilactobacillus fermentum]|nr:hypothetical protein [Limosilactobacillus fermentum]
MKINVKEDLKELVNFESNKDDIKMVNAAGDVKEDKYGGPTPPTWGTLPTPFSMILGLKRGPPSAGRTPRP